jgi:hypothetical protein
MKAFHVHLPNLREKAVRTTNGSKEDLATRRIKSFKKKEGEGGLKTAYNHHLCSSKR